MKLTKQADIIKAVFPGWIYKPLFRVVNAVLGPASYAIATGHFASCLKGRPVDRSGQPVPWLPNPVVAMLNGMQIEGKRVLEYGSGNSTLYFERRNAAQIITVEDDAVWLTRMRQIVKLENKNRITVLSPQEAAVGVTGMFDIILVDGCDRGKAACESIFKLAPGGVMITDNTEESEWLPYKPSDCVVFKLAGWANGNGVPNQSTVVIRK